MKVKANQGDTAELICYRYFGYTAGITEQVLDDNPGLAALGPILPMGTEIILPDAEAPAEKKMVNLWD